MAVERDGLRVEQRLPGRQGRLTLAYLAVNDDRWVTRDELAFALWGDVEPSDAESGLSSVLSKIRRVLGGDLVQGRSSLRFVPDDTTYVDLHFARDALHRAQVHADAGRPDMAWQPAHSAYAVARRTFLVGLQAPWIDDWRSVVESLELDALECETHALLGVGELLVAVNAAQRLVDRAPYRESGYCLLMRALDSCGNRAQSLLVYERLRTLLAEELGVAPGPEVTQLHQRLLGAP
jgi:DNA-binding SARP family transcriptional activator